MAKFSYDDPINTLIEAKRVAAVPRGYLGMSQMGHECSRYLYYVLHGKGSASFSPRTMRIFERGTWEENRVIKDLDNVGLYVYNIQKEVSILGGEVKGHIDGMVDWQARPHLLEIKTMADTYWKLFARKGVKISHPGYYWQCQFYATELGVADIIFVAVNKNTEMRKFEHLKATGESCVDRAIEIIGAYEPPPRIGGCDWHVCKLCGLNEYCHFEDTSP